MKGVKAIVSLLVALLPGGVHAADEIQSAQGRTVRFMEWSPPKNIYIDSSSGPKLALIRSCEVLIGPNFEPGDTQTIDFITDPAGGHFWIGRSFGKYVFFSGEIIGLEATGDRILFRKGFQSSEAFPEETVELSRRLEGFVERPFTSHLGQQVDLTRVFGHDPVYGRVAAPIRSIFISDVNVGAEALTLGMTTAAKMRLVVTLDAHLVCVSARLNDEPILLLDDGSPKLKYQAANPNRLAYSHGSPQAVKVPSAIGDLLGSQIAIDFPYVDEDQQMRNHMTKSVVVSKSGQIWFGPDRCQVVTFGGKLVGVEERETKVNLYVSDKRIPTTAESKDAFDSQLSQFAREVISGQLKEDIQINPESVFSDDFEAATEITVHHLRVVGEHLEITIGNADGSKDRFKILITDQLVIAAKEKITWQPRVPMPQPFGDYGN